MCRIAGFWDFDYRGGYDLEKVLTSMRDALAYGGPDDAGNFIRNNVFPYIDYFSPLRSGEILLFRKIERGNESGN